MSKCSQTNRCKREIMIHKETERSKTMAQKKEIAVKQPQEIQGNSPADMIRMAVQGKADLTSLEKLLELQERYEANEARKEYHRAMADFKANPPKIGKDKKVGYSTQKGNVGYSHASLANVTEKISTELSKHGLSASWSTKQNGQVMVTCKITHIKGHSEETTLAAPSDTSGSKNPIQAIGSTITYLERYTLLALTGLATFDMDDDGNMAGKPHVEMPSATETPQNKPQHATVAPPKGKATTGKDLPETDEMNARASEIAEDFEATENLMQLEEKAAKYRNEINTKMSKAYGKWLKQQYESAKSTIEAQAKEKLNG
jgi:hypothetical protein